MGMANINAESVAYCTMEPSIYSHAERISAMASIREKADAPTKITKKSKAKKKQPRYRNKHQQPFYVKGRW